MEQQARFGRMMEKANAACFSNLSDAVATFVVNGQDVSTPVLFDADYQRLDVGMLGVASSSPVITLSATVLPVDDPAAEELQVRVQRGAQVWLFTVVESHPDGVGGLMLFLEGKCN